MLLGANWKRCTLFTTDDDAGVGFMDAFQRLLVAQNANIDKTAAAEDAAGKDVTSGDLLAREHFDVSSITVSWEVSPLLRANVEQHLDQLYKSQQRIMLVHARDTVAEVIFRSAYAKGMIGMGADGVLRQ
jgi:hypothetical protein